MTTIPGPSPRRHAGFPPAGSTCGGRSAGSARGRGVRDPARPGSDRLGSESASSAAFRIPSSRRRPAIAATRAEPVEPTATAWPEAPWAAASSRLPAAGRTAAAGSRAAVGPRRRRGRPEAVGRIHGRAKETRTREASRAGGRVSSRGRRHRQVAILRGRPEGRAAAFRRPRSRMRDTMRPTPAGRTLRVGAFSIPPSPHQATKGGERVPERGLSCYVSFETSPML